MVWCRLNVKNSLKSIAYMTSTSIFLTEVMFGRFVSPTVPPLGSGDVGNPYSKLN